MHGAWRTRTGYWCVAWDIPHCRSACSETAATGRAHIIMRSAIGQSEHEDEPMTFNPTPPFPKMLSTICSTAASKNELLNLCDPTNPIIDASMSSYWPFLSCSLTS